MKAVAMAALFTRAGLHVPAGEGARVDYFDEVLADIGDEQDIREHLSTFSAHLANLARIVDRASQHSLVILDEVGVGTDPGEGAALAQAILEKLADCGARTIATTHYNLLKELAESDARFSNASVDFDPDTLEPTYRLRTGFAGASSAVTVAARMGLRSDVLERANQILDREDRQLDRMLAELAASRAALEREQLETARIREDTENVRSLHRAKLERLQQRRDDLYQSMRKDLDRKSGNCSVRPASKLSSTCCTLKAPATSFQCVSGSSRAKIFSP
jgi:DNA mismatch repair protein MutS2